MMRKISAIALLMAAALTLSACGTEDKLQVENGGTPSESSSGNAPEESSGDNAEKEPEESSGENSGEITEEQPPEVTLDEDVLALINQFEADSFIGPDGAEVKLTEATSQLNDYILHFDFAYMRYAEPVYSDTISNPDLYDFENFAFTIDENAEVEAKPFKVVKGQVLDNGLTVKEVSYELSQDSLMYENSFTTTSVELEGEITLEGLLFCYFEEEYGFDQNEVIFYPNPASGTVPLIFDPYLHTKSGVDLYSEFAFVCDSDVLRLGSIDDIGSPEWFKDGAYVRVKATLENLQLNASDFIGTRCFATLKNVEFLDK